MLQMGRRACLTTASSVIHLGGGEVEETSHAYAAVMGLSSSLQFTK
jgi:hypothetical protein